MKSTEQEWSMGEGQAMETEYTQKMSDYGIEVIDFSPEEYDHLAKVVMEDVWPDCQSLVGKKLLDDAVAALEAIR